MNLFDLTGKVALVTGSTKGIGEAIVHRFAEHGAKVVVSSRKADACEKVAGDINKERGKEVALAVLRALGGGHPEIAGAMTTAGSATHSDA